ncbi:MAG: Membrane-associated phospholipid phosphatase, partial [Gemmatimonadetes bacterium]|nr:Membrane-associated phospholipid phosphatase [Gemmatimonadota bacterium]
MFRLETLARRHPRVYLAAYAAGGLLLVALLVWAFAVLADEVPENGWMVHLDQAITGFIQARDTEGGERFFVTLSLLGGPVLAALVTIVTLALALRREWLRAAVIALGSAMGAGLNSILKQAFHRGRPEYATEFIPHSSWSFPSGHAMNSLVAYGILLVVLLEYTHDSLRRRLIIAGTAILIFLIALSRVYLGVHYLSDVIAGWL